jgi:hypothetical protein
LARVSASRLSVPCAGFLFGAPRLIQACAHFRLQLFAAALFLLRFALSLLADTARNFLLAGATRRFFLVALFSFLACLRSSCLGRLAFSLFALFLLGLRALVEAGFGRFPGPRIWVKSRSST